MGEAAGQAEERVHLVEREVTNDMYISKEGNRKTVVKKTGWEKEIMFNPIFRA